AGAVAAAAAVAAIGGSNAERPGGLGLAAVIAGVVGLALAPASAWWVGLVLAPWLMGDPSPARRVVACWWLSQSVLTPLYLPYARLWLPLHAAGWLMLAGLAAWALREGQGFAATTRRRAWVIGAAVAIVAAGWASGRGARPFGASEVLGPTDGLRSALATLPERLGGRPEGVDVLGRRPIAFYLTMQGIPATLMPGGADAPALTPQPGRWVLLDGALDDSTLGPVRRALDADRRWQSARIDPAGPLDPVTRLDVRPASAFEPDDPGPPLTVYTPGPIRLEPPR
ncbi:MAG: hypothetical protein K2X91_14180, partial [Thermoleophilia bacterium]|nr:hypothetical protein [Thermoleophilia bacterium]